MCQFVPGEVLAFGPISKLRDLGPGLPGTLTLQPLVTEGGELPPTSPFWGIGAATLQTDPGLELYGVSQLSARLGPLISERRALVDLNHILPLAAAPVETESFRLSPHAERLALSLRTLLRELMPNPPLPRPMKVAVLDSGLSALFAPHRELTYYDYSVGGRLQPNAPRLDPSGHGTRVAKILDEILPPEVELAIGRLPPEPEQLTALTIANALADLAARSMPEVINLGVAPRADACLCPVCRSRVSVQGFLPTFFSLLLRLASSSEEKTVTVLPAGNTGQVCNSRWLHPDLDTVLIAVAENRRGERTRYSGAPQGPLADLFSAMAFGGDDPDEPGAMGAFADGAHGTSFAAPFLAALALLGKRLPPVDTPPDLGPQIRMLLETASAGQRLFHDPIEDDDCR